MSFYLCLHKTAAAMTDNARQKGSGTGSASLPPIAIHEQQQRRHWRANEKKEEERVMPLCRRRESRLTNESCSWRESARLISRNASADAAAAAGAVRVCVCLHVPREMHVIRRERERMSGDRFWSLYTACLILLLAPGSGKSLCQLHQLLPMLSPSAASASASSSGHSSPLIVSVANDAVAAAAADSCPLLLLSHVLCLRHELMHEQIPSSLLSLSTVSPMTE